MHAFQNELNQILQLQLDSDNETLTFDIISEKIVQALHAAAEKALPKSVFNQHVKPYWSKQLKDAHDLARYHRRIWVAYGKPRGVAYLSYVNYKSSKTQFRRFQRNASDTYLNKIYDELDEAAELDYRLFWKLLRKRSNTRGTGCHEIIVNGQTFSPESEVAEGFAAHFQTVFKANLENRFSSFENDVKNVLGNIENLNLEQYPEILECDVRETEISKLIKTLKRRKAPGMDLVQNEHIIYGGHVINKYLMLLFNKILTTEVVPNSWKYSMIIPLYKGGGKPKANPSSYRPISLCHV